MNCPNCNSTDILPITYGAPSLEGARLIKAIEEKEILLGGCFLCGDAPAYYCRSCEHRFGDATAQKKSVFSLFPGKRKKSTG